MMICSLLIVNGLKISDMIVARGLNQELQFTCSARANTVTLDVIEALKKMNIVDIGMGLESGSDRVHSYLKGGVDVNDNERAINLLKGAGISANASFVIGSPDETESEVMQTYNFIRRSKPDFMDIFVLTPLPGTPVWEDAYNRGLVSEDMDWGCLNSNFNENVEKAIIVSKVLDRKQIYRLYKKFQKLRFIHIIKSVMDPKNWTDP